MPAVAPAPLRPETGQRFRWTRERYDRAVDAGVLTTADRVELLDGEIVQKMSQNEPHAVSTTLASDLLRSVFGDGFHVRTQLPIALSEVSEPEPDVAVVRGNVRDYLDDHPDPSSIVLLVEVADSSLMDDRVHKAILYADAGITEYWIVNLMDRLLEVHREPVGAAYRTKTTFGPEGTVAPLHAPDARISVADLLP
ncbi:MAG TPA: Uma2 family endonuclease [Rubricoccaceae bacterium]|nr:Uma2 family endonuclease [Rubricoccaceae bacterium]